jgi:hypothetical protein
MALTTNDLGAINAGISVLPILIDLIKSFHTVANPGAPPLTDAQILQILLDVGNASIAKDEAYKASHPLA